MSQAKPGHDGSPNGIDLTAYPTAQKLATRSLEFLQEIQNLYHPSPTPSSSSIPLTKTSQHPRQSPRGAPKPRLRPRQSLLRRLLHLNQARSGRRLGRERRARRSQVPPWQNQASASGELVHEFDSGVFRFAGGLRWAVS
jgi:hypothetical protein